MSSDVIGILVGAGLALAALPAVLTLANLRAFAPPPQPPVESPSAPGFSPGKGALP